MPVRARTRYERGYGVELDEFVREELARHDWAALRCGCGDTADHLPLLFESILTAETPAQLRGYSLVGHVEWDNELFACTPAAVGVIVCALSARCGPFGRPGFPGELSAHAREELLGTLWSIVTSEFVPAEPAGIEERIREAVVEGFWPLVRIGLVGRAPEAETVLEIFRYLGLDGERTAHYRRQLEARVAARGRHWKSRT
ncbi:hypothetical protein [Streptomyces sp. NPDC051909]|uniref:hypothetical protein n=1 Tax=Streptomyces sp. NPDC051909 TaxID=3154944 RepID=UPI00342B0F21